MNKKLIGLAIAVFVGICAAESLLALRKALQEKADREAAAAGEAEAAAETETSGPEGGAGEAKEAGETAEG